MRCPNTPSLMSTSTQVNIQSIREESLLGLNRLRRLELAMVDPDSAAWWWMQTTRLQAVAWVP